MPWRIAELIPTAFVAKPQQFLFCGFLF